MITPTVLVLSYYDGPTSGFINGFRDEHVYYFKVVAWDDEQDRRLYALWRVDSAVFAKLANIISRTGQTPRGAVWTPKWTFEDASLETQANNLVLATTQSLGDPVILAMGDDLQEAEVVRPTARGLALASTLASASEPGNLEAWLAKDRE